MTAFAVAASENDRFALRTMVVRQVRWEAEGVISMQLASPDGSPVPVWSPGAHIDVVLPSGLVRQYSLCGDPADRTSLTVAVLHERNGRGGSREIHETQLVGRTVGVRGPRNHFKLRAADEYLLIAGGIGVTPLLAMARHLDAQGEAWRLVYGGRSRASMAFLGELAAFGGAVRVVPQDEAGLPDLDAVLDSASPGTEVYCCGPEGLLRAVEAAGAARAIPVHVERFGTAGPAAVVAEPAAAVAERGDASGESTGSVAARAGAFEVELRRTGITVDVDPDRTILEAVREHLPEVISSCEEGFCGACETRVIEGIPEHRDQVLDPVERESNETMMICVGRSCTPRLVLDL
ncbi:PDR/VanB family oxidoreductase [Nocardioides sp. Iso805N]|uniref:PDR/VanB family oxidoreductase n=1 Tax=Nocardioides sp. Iso805N TaxID=1283287 RepID=UPI000361755E|nr:PDR/VanB family oxidoreductase [Nocardioides sp. Iso805N]